MRNTKIAALAVLAVGLWILDWYLIQQVIYQSQPLAFWLGPALVISLAIAFTTFLHLASPRS